MGLFDKLVGCEPTGQEYHVEISPSYAGDGRSVSFFTIIIVKNEGNSSSTIASGTLRVDTPEKARKAAEKWAKERGWRTWYNGQTPAKWASYRPSNANGVVVNWTLKIRKN